MAKSIMVWLGIALIAGASVFGVYLVDQNKISCSTESTLYQTKEVPDEYLSEGDKEVATEGVNGEIEVCYKKDKQYSKAVLTLPVDEVVKVGTDREEPVDNAPVYTEPVYDEPDIEYVQQCAVTLCNDGTCSESQGRGTCSYHGGVNTYY